MAARPVRSDSGWSRMRQSLATVSGIAGIAYVLLLLLPLMDGRFNALKSHPEDYASGAFGLAVHASYLALAIALGSLAASLLPVKGWAGVIPVLLSLAGLACAVLAVDPIGMAASQWVLLAIVGLALTPAIATLTIRSRFGAWRGAVNSLGIAALIGFGALVVAPESIGGLVNRVFDLLLGLWVAAAGLALRAANEAWRGAAPPRFR